MHGHAQKNWSTLCKSGAAEINKNKTHRRVIAVAHFGLMCEAGHWGCLCRRCAALKAGTCTKKLPIYSRVATLDTARPCAGVTLASTTDRHYGMLRFGRSILPCSKLLRRAELSLLQPVINIWTVCIHFHDNAFIFAWCPAFARTVFRSERCSALSLDASI